MTREEFRKRMSEVDVVESQSAIRRHLRENSRGAADLPVCVGELAELTVELTRHQRGQMHPDDLLQELAHVQWAVWRLQDMFCVNDETLRKAVQASFR